MLNVVDVSNPTAPQQASVDQSPAHGPQVIDDTAFAGADESVQALRVDALDGTVHHRGSMAVADAPRDLAGRDNRLFVAAGAAGLIVLNVSFGPPAAKVFLPNLGKPSREPVK
jgi:hypothetical protein